MGAKPDIVMPHGAGEPDPDAGIVKNAVEFAHTAYNLQDHEALEAIDIMRKYQRRWIYRARWGWHNWEDLADFLEELGGNIQYEFAERLNLLTRWDPTPVLEGKPPLLEVMDKMPSDDIHKFGFDHERKGFEVRKAVGRGEEFLGQKERVDARRPTMKK